MLAVNLFFASSAFPFIILLDYHKKENWHKAFWFLLVFYSSTLIGIPLLLKGMQVIGLRVLLLVPFFLFLLVLKSLKNQSPNSNP